MIRRMKAAIQDFCEQFGFRPRLVSLEEYRPFDVRETTNDPRSLHYYRKTPTVLIDAPVSKGYGLDHFPLDPEGPHPFVRAVAAARESDVPEEAIRDVLANYYESVQPDSAAEWLGFNRGEVPELDNEPPWARIFPWRSTSLEDMKRGMRKAARLDNAQSGAKLSIQDGWRSFGPVSPEILEIEVNRLFELYRSVKKNGIIRDDSPDDGIMAVALVDSDGDWRWLTNRGGQHRVAAISAMGFDSIPIRIWAVVYYAQVHLWPHVGSGVFPEDTAAELFEQYFNDKLPRVACSWSDEIEPRKST